MPTITIQQFRATLAGGSGRDTLVRAYRKLSRRPELATVMRAVDWVAWPPAALPETNA